MSETPDTNIPEGFRPFRDMMGFIAVNGPLYLRRVGGEVLMGFRVEERHCNPMGICHGGMLATFADMLIPLSLHRKYKEIGARFLPTISLQVDYMAPSPLGAWVQGEAELLRSTKTLVFAQGTATADGKPVLRVSGIFKLGPPLAEVLKKLPT